MTLEANLIAFGNQYLGPVFLADDESVVLC